LRAKRRMKNSHHELPIISNGSEEVVGLVVPRDVLQEGTEKRKKSARLKEKREGRKTRTKGEKTHLDYRSMTSVDVERIERVVGFRVSVDVPVERKKSGDDQLEAMGGREGREDVKNSPMANGRILRSTQHMSRLDRVPAQSVTASESEKNNERQGISLSSLPLSPSLPPFLPPTNPQENPTSRLENSPLLNLTLQPNIRSANPIRRRLTRMLGPIEDVDVSGHGLCREQVWVLRHVPSSVDLSVVRDGLDRFDAGVGEGWGGEFCDH